MAVLYLIFALGALVDLDLPPYNYEADHYFDLACAAMSIKPLFEQPTAVTVQALMLLSCYYTHGGRRFSMDSGWNTVSLASSISQRVGDSMCRCEPHTNFTINQLGLREYTFLTSPNPNLLICLSTRSREFWFESTAQIIEPVPGVYQKSSL
jgi:hypothetical protein